MNETERAAMAFQSLLALDLSPAQRQELEASSVPQHTIDALYPPLTPYVGIEPHLIKHVSRLSDARLLEGSEALSEQALKIWEALPSHLSSASDEDSDADDEAAKLLNPTFNVYLFQRFSASPLIDREYQARHAADRISHATWAAYWLMSNRKELELWDSEEPLSSATDRLMIAVAQTLALGSEVG